MNENFRMSKDYKPVVLNKTIQNEKTSSKEMIEAILGYNTLDKHDLKFDLKTFLVVKINYKKTGGH